METPSLKYFKAENANRLIAGQQFEIVDQIAGTLIGVLSADGKLADELTALAKDPKSAVKEITGAQYAEYRKKKAPGFENLTHSNHPFPVAPSGTTAQVTSTPIKGQGALLVPNGNVPPPEPEGAELETAADAIQVSAVQAPETAAEQPISNPSGKQKKQRS